MPRPLNLTEKILAAHLVGGSLQNSSEIAIKPDQVLTPDATGTMVYLQFEATRLKHIKSDFAVIYIDHNLLQVGFENADDHRYLASVAAKFGAHLSRAGNGICHQLHLESYARPGGFLLGSDSHTPTAGGVGMLGIGAGGLDVAVALAGSPYYLRKPKVMKVELTGKLQPWVSAKDVVLEILRRLTVKGGVGCILEYTGKGVSTLSVYERATITNMGAELGATSSIFSSDERTREFLYSIGREEDWRSLEADPGADYDEEIVVRLDELEPLIACPHSPDNVVKVSEMAGTPVQQVVIGSCTNSSLEDMAITAEILKGKIIPPDISLVIAPGTRRVLRMMVANGILDTLLRSGARLIEVGCGPCNAIGQSPASGSVSVRTVNRNYHGRSGTEDALVYLASPAVAAATALNGRITDPRELGEMPELKISKIYPIDDDLIIAPLPDGEKTEIVRGPNIKPVPDSEPLQEKLDLIVMLKTGDNVSTDDIIPGGANLLALRSNVPAMASYSFNRLDKSFVSRVKEINKPWMVVGGINFGQGSSREHAVLAPLYLGLKLVIAKSFARIYRQNLINYGILPLVFANQQDYDCLNLGDNIRLEGLRTKLLEDKILVVENKDKNLKIKVTHDLSQREVDIVLSGGLLQYISQS